MNIINSIIMGIVEGLTEFLPISSTAHLDLTRTFLGLPSTEFIKSFEVIIQLGAILAVAVWFWPRIRDNFRLAVTKLAAAFLPTAIIGAVLYKIIKTYFLGNTVLIVSTLLIGGIVIVLFEKFHQPKAETDTRPVLETITIRQAMLIGCAQSLAMVPGVSRSAATIIGGLSMGISRKAIAEFSFLLAIPTMAAATGLDLIKSGWTFSSQEYLFLGLGFLSAFISALIVIKWFMAFIQKHSFTVFGWYRILIGGFLTWWFWFR